jgi:STE24 endopeptidase
VIPAPPQLFAIAVAALIVGRWLAQIWLERLNQQHVHAHAGAVPEALREMIDAATYAKSVAYTLVRSRLRQVEVCSDAVVLLLVLFSGVLPWGFSTFLGAFGLSVWAAAGFLFLMGVMLALPGLPFDWYDQFHIEERFGFNTMTRRLWLLDRLKGLLISAALGYPLLVLVLKIIEWTGAWWWLWAWSCLTGFQLLMFVLAPVLILPLFNKFTPLPEGALRSRLLALAERTRFRARSIQVMDGSKRSRHSNAFFTGFGRARKIVLFDTLIEQLSEAELEPVLAHEIGHWRKRHIPKMLLGSAAGALAGFYVLGVAAGQTWFCGAFGFARGAIAPALLLFGLLAGTFTFWLSPLLHAWSRRFEYEADAFAADAIASAAPLITALRRLNEKNLSNLTPHPLYSGFYYSHPTLLERERALRHLALTGADAPLS